ILLGLRWVLGIRFAADRWTTLCRRTRLGDLVPGVEPALGDPARTLANHPGDSDLDVARRVDKTPELHELREQARLVLAWVVSGLGLRQPEGRIDGREGHRAGTETGDELRIARHRPRNGLREHHAQRAQPEAPIVEGPAKVVQGDAGPEECHRDRDDELVTSIEATVRQRSDRPDRNQPFEDVRARLCLSEELVAGDGSHVSRRTVSSGEPARAGPSDPATRSQPTGRS